MKHCHICCKRNVFRPYTANYPHIAVSFTSTYPGLEELRRRPIFWASEAGQNIHGRDSRSVWPTTHGNVCWFSGKGTHGFTLSAACRTRYQPFWLARSPQCKEHVRLCPSSIIGITDTTRPCRGIAFVLFIIDKGRSLHRSHSVIFFVCWLGDNDMTAVEGVFTKYWIATIANMGRVKFPMCYV